MASTIGGNDPAQILRGLRDRIAVALHTGQGEVINWFNNRNMMPQKHHKLKSATNIDLNLKPPKSA